MLIQRKPSRKILLKVGDAAPALQPLLDYYDELERSGLSFEMLSSQRIREYQLHALNVTLRHAWKHNDFYRHAFIQAGLSKPEIADLGEMTRIPFLSKDDIRGEKSSCCAVIGGRLARFMLISVRQAGRFILPSPLTISMCMNCCRSIRSCSRRMSRMSWRWPCLMNLRFPASVSKDCINSLLEVWCCRSARAATWRPSINPWN